VKNEKAIVKYSTCFSFQSRMTVITFYLIWTTKVSVAFVDRFISILRRI